MKNTDYSEKLKNPKWQKKRLEIMKRDKFQCKLCGDTETQLHVHHKEYITGNDPWEYNNGQLITLCEKCHGVSESVKKKIPGFELKYLKAFKLKSKLGVFSAYDYKNKGLAIEIKDELGEATYFDFNEQQTKQFMLFLSNK
jgi:hypothetical protein